LINVYTDQGIYNINNKDVFFLNTIDKEIQILEKYYNNFTIILDPSFYLKEKVSSVNGETYLSIITRKDYYKIYKNSDIKLVIEYNNNDNKLLPYDIYFEIANKDSFNKEELIEFLSLLN
jgi:hypothetical protein